MEEILEKKVKPRSTKSLEVKQQPLARTVNPQLEAIETLTVDSFLKQLSLLLSFLKLFPYSPFSY